MLYFLQNVIRINFKEIGSFNVETKGTKIINLSIDLMYLNNSECVCYISKLKYSCP